LRNSKKHGHCFPYIQQRRNNPASVSRSTPSIPAGKRFSQTDHPRSKINLAGQQPNLRGFIISSPETLKELILQKEAETDIKEKDIFAT